MHPTEAIMTREAEMTPNPSAQPASTGPLAGEMPARIDSTQILRGQRTIEIEHGEQRYTLRVTKDNKLILTK
jgi:hemin uptake protein HemP